MEQSVNCHKLLSFIIPVYNLGRYLQTCLDSLYSQGIDPSLFEVVIVNDGSTDDSLEIIYNLSTKYTNLIIVNQENSGVSIARNRGIEASSAEYISFIDADDQLCAESMVKVFDTIKKFSDSLDVAFFQSYCKTYDGKIVEINHWKNNYEEKVEYGCMDLLRNNVFLNGGCVWGCIYRRLFLVRNKLEFGARIANSEDSIFTYMVLSKRPRVFFFDIPYYINVEREGSASRSDSMKRVDGFSNNIIFVKKMHIGLTEDKLEKQIVDACLYNTISSATNMYIKIGGRNWKYIYNVLEYSTLWKMNVPWFPPHQRKKIALINFSFYFYFKTLFVKYRVNNIIYKLCNNGKVNYC